MRKVYIYVLRDPRNNDIRYVGKTIQAVRDRLHAHIRQAKKYSKWHKDRWIRVLLNEGFRPSIEVAEEVTSENWEARERHWISHYKEIGCNLTNVTDGGEGLHGHKFSKEHREKLSNALRGNNRWLGKSHQPETKKKMSENMKGEKNPNYGREFSKEYRRKLSEAQKKRPPFTGEVRRKISQSAMGNQYAKGHKQTSEHRRKLAIARATRIREKLIDNGDYEIIEKCVHRNNASNDICLDCGEIYE